MVSAATFAASAVWLAHTFGLGVGLGVAFPAAVVLVVLCVWRWRSPRLN